MNYLNLYIDLCPKCSKRHIEAQKVNEEFTFHDLCYMCQLLQDEAEEYWVNQQERTNAYD